MKIAYSEWSRGKLIAECKFLLKSLHLLGKEATDTQRRLTRLEDSIIRFLLKRSITTGIPVEIKDLFESTHIKDLPRILNPVVRKVDRRK